MDSSRRRALALAVMWDEEEEKRFGFTIYIYIYKKGKYGEYHHLFHELCLDDERFQLDFRLSGSHDGIGVVFRIIKLSIKYR